MGRGWSKKTSYQGGVIGSVFKKTLLYRSVIIINKRFIYKYLYIYIFTNYISMEEGLVKNIFLCFYIPPIQEVGTDEEIF